jgi:hypothetical protein
MAGSAQVSVGTSPILLASSPPAATYGATGWFQLANSGTSTVYIGGGTGVTSSNGYPVAGTSGTLNGWLFAGDSVYGVVASGGGTSTISVLQTGL